MADNNNNNNNEIDSDSDDETLFFDRIDNTNTNTPAVQLGLAGDYCYNQREWTIIINSLSVSSTNKSASPIILNKSPNTTIEDLYTDRIGGFPIYYSNNNNTESTAATAAAPSVPEPHCLLCNSILILVIQLYTPAVSIPILNGDDRFIYVYHCRNIRCQNQSPGWTVLRFRINTTTNTTTTTAAATTTKSISNPPAVIKSTHPAPVLDNTDWGVAADDWDNDTNTDTDNNTTTAAAADIEKLLQQRESNTNTTTTINTNNNTITTTIPAAIITDIDNLTNSLSSSTINNNNNNSIQSYSALLAYNPFYLIFQTESNTIATANSNTDRYKRLLAEYELNESIDNNNNNTTNSNSNNPTDTIEINNLIDNYESSHHAIDPLFSRFTARLQREPQQLIRYQWNGIELIHHTENNNNTNNSSNRGGVCDYCNNPRIFEFQLMPYLNQLLIIKQQQQQQQQSQQPESTVSAVDSPINPWSSYSDWISCTIWVCPNSCGIGKYQKEHITITLTV